MELKGVQENTAIKFFATLGCTFWDGDNKITKEYRHKLKSLVTSMKISKNETETKNTTQIIKKLEKSYDNIINPKNREKYLKFLFVNFVFSQPYSIEKLKTNFLNYVFPFYLFVIQGKKDTDSVNFLSLDYINFLISFFSKEKVTRMINIEMISSICKENGRIVMTAAKRDVVEIVPEILQQIELIYILLILMKKTKSEKIAEKCSSNLIDEHNVNITYNKSNSMPLEKVDIDSANFRFRDLKLMKDEIYLPSGIILKASIWKINKKTHFKNERYIVLGNSNILIFKDETMLSLCNVIPIIPCYILFSFDESTLMMKITLVNRSYKIFFKAIDVFQIWRTTIFDIADCRIDEKIQEELLIPGIFPGEDEINDSHPQVVFLEQKIKETEEKLSKLKARKEMISKYVAYKRQEMEKMLNASMDIHIPVTEK